MNQAGNPKPAREILQTVTLEDGTDVEIRALTPAEASRVRPNFFTWDDATATKVAAMAIVSPEGILERSLGVEERERILRATGNAWLHGWVQTKRPDSGPRASKKGERISPSFTAEKLHGANDTIENRIDVYQDRLHGWLVKWANHLNEVPGDEEGQAGFAALQLSLSYFEAHAAFRRGQDSPRGSSFDAFAFGVLEVFPEFRGRDHTDFILKTLWRDGRNGLFHRGTALKRIRLQGDPKTQVAFRYETDRDGKRVRVCGRSLVRRILTHFEQYVKRLREPAEVELRENFQRAWRLVHRK